MRNSAVPVVTARTAALSPTMAAFDSRQGQQVADPVLAAQQVPHLFDVDELGLQDAATHAPQGVVREIQGGEAFGGAGADDEMVAGEHLEEQVIELCARFAM